MRSAYIRHQPVQAVFTQPSRTQQSFTEETNINSIMSKYQKTGIIDHINEYGPTYGDQASAEDYHAAMVRVAATNSIFAELPSSVREGFDNDPSQFLEYVADEDRRNAVLKDKKFNQEDDKSETPADDTSPPFEADPAE